MIILGPTILYVLQAKRKETKRQNKLIVHTFTFTGRVIALTIVSVIIPKLILSREKRLARELRQREPLFALRESQCQDR